MKIFFKIGALILVTILVATGCQQSEAKAQSSQEDEQQMESEPPREDPRGNQQS